jgi:ATP-dependent exoDNAse (exonuclease V) beta subunit
MKPTGHVMILASAGSGKTYALTNRFVRLLAGGAAPERIVALTFTRKAAGEFFDEILHKLAQAAAEAAAARKLAAEIGAPGLGPGDFLRLLRVMIEAMPRLNLGTLDSFFARIVRSFPLELGLGGEFTLLEESAARLERRRVLQRLFTAGGEPDAAQKEFIEAFKRATFGTEEKQLTGRLEEFLDQHTGIYLEAPRSELWGDPRRIWPEGTEWMAAKPDRTKAAEALRAALPWAVFNDKQRLRLEDFFAELPAWQPGAPLPGAVEYLVKNALAVWDELRAGRAELTLERRKVALDPGAGHALAALTRAIVGAELARKLEMTRGLFAVLRGYESVYHEAVRREGRLTFADVQRLLLPAADAPVLATEAGEGRLLIDWRLDAQFDHWLLDEFQDTSYAQWSVLRNLLDEAVQDPEGKRSLFYVGDVKQSIFAWREGDPRLFREIFHHYNRAAPGAIAEQHLTDSWRSGPAVIAMVNRVFGDQEALRALVPADAAARWSDEWRAHASARPELGGYAELRHADDEAGRFAETLRILREVEPARRGLSAAVIVQKNDTGARLADYLRREGNLSAVAESDLHVATDNPLTAALLALLRAAAHPGDSFAREHLAMTPLGEVLRAAGLGDPDGLTRRVLGELQAEGFAATIERWLRTLEPHLTAGDQFSRLRGRQLVDMAREFDKEARGDVAEFLTWVEGCTVRETDTAGVVRVLTVHKAKGLGFDLVILPDVEGQTMAQRRGGLAVQKGADRAVEWVLELPGRIFHEHDPVLRAHVAAKESDAAHETLCKFYVAMTRAKRAMYVITKPVGTSASRNFPKLLEQTLGDAWADGDRNWYAKLTSETKAGPAAVEPALVAESTAGRVQRLPSHRPSDAKPGARLVALFQTGGVGAAEFGTRVHALFETVEWWDPAKAMEWTNVRLAEGADRDALAEVLGCLNDPGLAAVFIPPSGTGEVWRERAFEVVLDGAWFTGVFDRVIIARDAAGRARSARIIDFKTDRGRAGEDDSRTLENHAGQLNLYRRAAGILTGLPLNQVKCALVLTASRRLLEVPWPG